MHKHRLAAFTLLEISMVVVIIALVAAGVFVGRDLITAAKMRKIQQEQEAISTAVQVFKGKYNCMPGDCQHATDFWPQHADCPDLSTASTGTPGDFTNYTPTEETCDGDNDRLIDSNITTYEIATFWQHLGNAKLFGGGQFSGGFDINGSGFLPGVNFPPIAALGPLYLWLVVDGDNWQLLTNLFSATVSLPMAPGKYGTILTLGTGGTGTTWPLTPVQAQSLDTKYDDGIPATGKIVVTINIGAAASNCVEGSGVDETVQQAANAAAVYQTSGANRDGQNCSLAYVTGW